MDTNRKLIRSTGVIGFATLSSRILGFIRDVLFAGMFGTDVAAQAFVIAFRIPNMLRDMVGEGATNAAIVPVLTEYRHKNTDKEFWEASGVILNLMMAALLVLSAAGVLFTPLIVKIMAPGFLKDPEKFECTVQLTRYMFPYLIFLGFLAYSQGLLNSLRHFAAPAFAPVVQNAAMIIAIVSLAPVMGINGVVIGVMAGGFLQAVMQLFPLYKRGFRLYGKFDPRHPVALRIGKLLLPRFAGSGVYQLSVFVDTILASLAWIVGPGGVAALYYAHRLIHLPLAIFGVSLATAVLPRMSKESAENDINKLKSTVVFSLNTVFLVMVPAATGLMILSRPLVKALFERGEFTSYSTEITSSALLFYSIGLVAYSGIKILVNVFFSMGDTKTPVKTAGIALLINLVLNLILMFPLKIGGLALATSVAAIANFFMLYFVLSRRIGDIGAERILVNFAKIIIAASVMGLAVFAARFFFIDKIEHSLQAALVILVTIGFSAFVYFVSAYTFGAEGARGGVAIVLEKVRTSIKK